MVEPVRARLRNSAKAILIADGKLLCTANRDNDGVFYLLPGGGQRFGESLTAALQRECREEIGREVEVGALRLVREYIGANHEFAVEDPDLHQVEFMFECALREGEATEASEPDSWQTGVEWLPLDRLREYRLYPAALKELLGPEGVKPGAAIYMGDVN